MGLVQFIVLLVVLGVVFWLIETYLPMSEPFKTLLRVVAVLVLILLLLSMFGIVNVPVR